MRSLDAHSPPVCYCFACVFVFTAHPALAPAITNTAHHAVAHRKAASIRTAAALTVTSPIVLTAANETKSTVAAATVTAAVVVTAIVHGPHAAVLAMIGVSIRAAVAVVAVVVAARRIVTS